MKIYRVDAFTAQPFKGNPACVCLLDQARPDAWMLAVAAEMNLSETAFLLAQPGGYNLRWFTPRKGVRLCGHATLATAHILFEERIVRPGEVIQFATLSGLLFAQKSGAWIELDFPTRLAAPCEANPALNRALGVSPAFSSKASSPQGDVYLLELVGEDEVRALAPDFGAITAGGVRAVIVTAPSANPEFDFVSRYFAPAMGIDEDPVTGSAHCYLAPYWGIKLGKQTLTGFQASARTGVVACVWQGERVLLGGRAVTIYKADLNV